MSKFKEIITYDKRLTALLIGLFLLNGLSFHDTSGSSVKSSFKSTKQNGEQNMAALGIFSQGYHAGHSGVDIAAQRGTSIESFTNGKVVKVGDEDRYCYNRGYGKFVMIEEGSGEYTFLYAHMQKQLVEEGDQVEVGEELGLVGTSGLATGPHLHLTVYKTDTLFTEIKTCGPRLTGETVNPASILK